MLLSFYSLLPVFTNAARLTSGGHLKSDNQKPRGNASISVPSSNYLISTNDSPLNYPKVSQTMPTSFASWQQFPGEGLMGNQNYASHVYSRPQLSSHAHSNVYDNSVFGSENTQPDQSNTNTQPDDIGKDEQIRKT